MNKTIQSPNDSKFKFPQQTKQLIRKIAEERDPERRNHCSNLVKNQATNH